MPRSSLLIFALLVGCTTAGPAESPRGSSLASPGSKVTLSAGFNGGSTVVARGGEVTVDLPSSAGTSYKWVIMARPRFLRLASQEMVPAPRFGAGEVMVGGPVTNRFVFRATESGTGKLEFGLQNFVNKSEVAERWSGTIIIR